MTSPDAPPARPARPARPVAATPPVPRGVLILVALAAGFVVAFGIHLVSGILGPLFLALVLTIAAFPVRNAMVRRGLPHWLGTLAVVVAIYLGVVGLALLIVVSGAELAGLLPQYADNLTAIVADITNWFAARGVKPEQTQALASSLDLGRASAVLTSLLSDILSLVTNLVFVLALVLFSAMDARGFSETLTTLRTERPAFVSAMGSFTHGTRRYLVVATVFGAIVAVFDTLFLWYIGVPGALLWGVLAFITNYIPNIGFLIGLVPPAILALLDGGWGSFVLVVVVYSVINLIIQSVIQPKVVGDAVGLSALVTILSLVVWSLLIGAVGAVLAIPLTLLVKALLVDVDPDTRWLGGLLGDRPASPS
ncbi:AI-2E family transporter [Terrabacter sp. Soil810]|uniref:AI-2E family transporter n=1 Tax=Terrabacter sp. Soil810 TaxID=1736418 RepID=UPI001F3BD169|nr:AI-2E family transporter [Terrabacter sp. Soil810]